MKDWLIDDDRLSLGRKSILPGEGFFRPDSIESQQEERELKETLADAEIVVVADPDADGLACAALIREARCAGAVLPTSPHEIRDSMKWVAEYAPPSAELYICDLCPDSERDIGDLDAVSDRLEAVTWYDHHQWDTDLAEQVRTAGVELTVGDSENVCTADVALAQLEYEFDDQFADLAAVTRDHDLWIREDERSDDLADYAHWVEPETYIETVAEHGADLPPEARELLAERRVEKEALIEKAVERAEICDIGQWTVGIAYGRCSQNEVAEALREQGADASVIIKPAGSVSIRGTDSFQRCHEVAEQVNGGGHPKAAGCKPEIYDDMLDYAHHWTTRGAVTKQTLIEAFRQLD